MTTNPINVLKAPIVHLLLMTHKIYTVDSLLTDTLHIGPLLNNGHCHMYQLKSPYM